MHGRNKDLYTTDKWFHAGPTHKTLECWVSMNEIMDRGPWLLPFSSAVGH